MGYFSNGTEGMVYEAQWCDRCEHQDGPDGQSGCAVWLAHLLYSYKLCNAEDNPLNVLIPRSEDRLSNEQCRMFLKKSPQLDLPDMEPTPSALAAPDGPEPTP